MSEALSPKRKIIVRYSGSRPFAESLVQFHLTRWWAVLLNTRSLQQQIKPPTQEGSGIDGSFREKLFRFWKIEVSSLLLPWAAQMEGTCADYIIQGTPPPKRHLEIQHKTQRLHEETKQFDTSCNDFFPVVSRTNPLDD